MLMLSATPAMVSILWSQNIWQKKMAKMLEYFYIIIIIFCLMKRHQTKIPWNTVLDYQYWASKSYLSPWWSGQSICVTSPPPKNPPPQIWFVFKSILNLCFNCWFTSKDTVWIQQTYKMKHGTWNTECLSVILIKHGLFLEVFLV